MAKWPVLLVIAGIAALLVVLFVHSPEKRVTEELEPRAIAIPVAEQAGSSVDELLPAPSIASESRVDVETSATSSTAPSVSERTAVERERALAHLRTLEKQAESMPGDATFAPLKDGAELNLLQACVGQILSRENRALGLAPGTEELRIDLAPDEVKIAYDRKWYIVRRGEFPVFDEARDRFGADEPEPRSSHYYEDYVVLVARAKSTLGVPATAR